MSLKRERLIQSAIELFNRDGFHATGGDAIAEHSGVSKMTLYAHFRSKDDLILAALRRRDEVERNKIIREAERRASDPGERILAIFDIFREWFGSEAFRGCMFINATAEFTKAENPIHAAAAEHKRLFFSYLKEQCAAAGADDPEDLADQIFLVLEGAIVTAVVRGNPDSAARARRSVEILMAAALSQPAGGRLRSEGANLRDRGDRY